MRYLGGKSRIARLIAETINPERAGRLLWDPFCGGLSSAAALGPPLICSDAHAGLIALYRAVQADPTFLDWIPELTREDYEWAKTLDPSDPIAAFVGFGLSFRGQWFRGLAEARAVRAGGPVYSMLESSRRRVLADVAATGGAHFVVADFLAIRSIDTLFKWPGWLFGEDRTAMKRAWPRCIYLDPPYRGTQGYDGVPPFDYDAFVGRVDDWARTGATLWVNEYDFPLGKIVLELPRRKSGVSRSGSQPMERLYRVGP